MRLSGLLWVMVVGPSLVCWSAEGPRVFQLNREYILEVKQRLAHNDPALMPALQRLRQEADEALRMRPPSVMDKQQVPPSGDKHDYMSQAPYWWPDPNSPDGLPYIRRDGLRNPQIRQISDHENVGRMSDAVWTLALAYWFTGKEDYAKKARQFISTWFLDPNTRMNPHLEYGQAIPGINEGRGIGLIETRGLVNVVDAVGLLEGAACWSPEDQEGLRQWFSKFLRWMLESPKGKDEANAANNHGTYYDLQVACYALFVGQHELATRILQDAAHKRIARQIEPDGRQPLELVRTRSWSYSIGNLSGLMSLAEVASKVGVDFWHYSSEDGRSIRKALDYLVPFALARRPWPTQQIGGLRPAALCPLLRRAAIRYKERAYWNAADRIEPLAPDDRFLLLMPVLIEQVQDAASTAAPDARLDYKPGQAPDFWSIATARTIMARWPDFTKAYFNSWTYVNGYVLCGFEMLYNYTGDQQYIDYARRYIDRFIEANGDFVPVANARGQVRPIRFDNLDNMMTGNIVVMLYERTKDPRYKRAADNIRRALDDYPRNSDGGFWHARSLTGQMWIDGIFMGQMFLTRYGRSIGDKGYCWDEATRQITVYAKRAQKGDSGLYVHGIFEPGHGPRACSWADPNTGLSPEVWSEGLGWYALILVQTLADLPKEHPSRPQVEQIFRRLAAALKRTQDPISGRWFQVVDKGDRPDNWTDTSGSAMFTYAIAKGIELGLLPEDEYGPVVKKGYEGIVANARVNDKGLVDIYSACDGVGVQVDYDRYINYRKSINAKEAVAGFLWATTIVEGPRLRQMRQ
ncbi:MAG: alginate lyase family protein [Sedimentisphaerales bacterium]|nr:alginate lyase family protein [Sedimentisphaerales bacterium]